MHCGLEPYYWESTVPAPPLYSTPHGLRSSETEISAAQWTHVAREGLCVSFHVTNDQLYSHNNKIKKNRKYIK